MAGWTTGHSNYNTTTHLNIGGKSDTRLTNNNMFEFVISTNGQSDVPVWHQIARADINRDPDFTGNNVNITEKVINTIGQSDNPKWHLIVHKDITITAGNEAWKIPLTFATAGVNMPVELEGLREHNLLENRHSFNVSINNGAGLMTSKPTETNIPVREAMVVSGNWRTPHTGYSILKELFSFNTKNYQGAGLMSSKPVIVNVPVSERLVSDNHWRIPWQSTGDYEVSGITTDPATMLIIDEGSWEVIKAEQVVAGAYAITGLQNKKTLVVASKSNGETLAQGGIDPDQS
jgi:hypothetical protein